MAIKPTIVKSLEAGKVSLECSIINDVLRGGLMCKSITEIAGEAGSGKSQLAMQALVSAQAAETAKGAGGKVLWIYTDGLPPLKRLQAMIHATNTRAGRAVASMDNVLLHSSASTPEAMLACMNSAHAALHQASLSPSPVRLLVIDSVANVFRDIGDNPGVDELSYRASMLFRLAALLKKYADTFNMAVLITNQVMDDFVDAGGVLKAGGSGRGGPGRSLASSGRKVLPSLGLSWAHCVNTRLFLSKSEDASGRVMARTLQVVFSPHLPPSSCHIQIHQGGVSGIPRGQAAQPVMLPVEPRQSEGREQHTDHRTMAHYAQHHHQQNTGSGRPTATAW